MELLPDNREVLDSYRGGQAPALELVYRSYVRVVAGFLKKGFVFSSKGKALSFAGYADPEDLRDALQETFLLAFSKGARLGYNGLTPFSSYLLAIARNVVLGRFRKDMSRLSCFKPIGQIEGSEETVLPEDMLPATCGSLEQEATRLQVRQVVAAFVAELSEEERRVVRLYFEEGLSQEATAGAISADRNRVRKHIRAIRRKLWKRLKREGLRRELPLSLKSLELKP